jgi:hypothetical protein
MYNWAGMRRTLIIAALGAWMFAGGNAWGIDAKPKSDTAAARPATDTGRAHPAATQTKPSRTLLEKLKEEVRESKKDEAVQYNNFIDANNDGVDDRVQEKAKVKPEEPVPAEPASDSKKLDEPKTKQTSSTPSKPENTSVKKKKPR